ncbi:unnamed protein product, partial [Rotaria sp. Silwood1]
KDKVNRLLHLIKGLLPKPNLLPKTLTRMTKALKHVSSTSTSWLRSDCYQSCHTPEVRYKMCADQNCSTSFRQRQATEVIEIVRFDIRSQIQSIINRNAYFINKPCLFPNSDVC